MKGCLFYLKGKAEPWADIAAAEYAEKISRFIPFTREPLKSKSADRANADEKKRAEAEAVLSKINPRDNVILFDESGQKFKNSEEFSRELIKIISSGSQRVVLVIGGPYGFSEKVMVRAQSRWSLSGLTMNHHVAQIVALEQIYRAMTIWKGIPYHN